MPVALGCGGGIGDQNNTGKGIPQAAVVEVGVGGVATGAVEQLRHGAIGGGVFCQGGQGHAAHQGGGSIVGAGEHHAHVLGAGGPGVVGDGDREHRVDGFRRRQEVQVGLEDGVGPVDGAGVGGSAGEVDGEGILQLLQLSAREGKGVGSIGTPSRY